MNLQERYQKWHNEGMDLAFAFVQEIKSMVGDIFTGFQKDCDPEVRCLTTISISDSDTFESAWIDDQGRPCCAAKIDDGAPMGWRVEFLDLHHKRELHDLLQKMRDELTPNAEGESRAASTRTLHPLVGSLDSGKETK